jgi:hypothetical protein
MGRDEARPPENHLRRDARHPAMAGVKEAFQMTIWIYVDTRYHAGHPDHIKAFAYPEAAERWFKANDPEGVAFEYEVIK